MPLVTVWNSQLGASRGILAADLKGAALSLGALGGLGLGSNDVTVCIAGNDFSPSGEDLSHPCVIVVELLFDKPERTEEVRRTLAERLGKAAKEFFRNKLGINRVIEVAVKRFNPERDAFWSG